MSCLLRSVLLFALFFAALALQALLFLQDAGTVDEEVQVADYGKTVFPGKNWQTRAAAELCREPSYLDRFSNEVGGTGVIIKDGFLIKSWGNAAGRGMWASASKPVLTTLLFFAQQEGRVDVDDKICRFIPALKGKDRLITFYHLANMTSGYARQEYPGEAFAYNDFAIKLYHDTLFGGVFRETGTGVEAKGVLLAEKRLAALQFEDGNLFEKVADYGYFVHTSPRDFARIGWFWLNRGNWNGKQLLSREFFDQYLKPQVPVSLPVSRLVGRDYLGIGSIGGGANQSQVGPGVYGMNWWFNADRMLWPSAPEDTYQANGHWNQETVTVIPSMRMVVAGRGDFGSFKPGPGQADTLMDYLVRACGP